MRSAPDGEDWLQWDSYEPRPEGTALRTCSEAIKQLQLLENGRRATLETAVTCAKSSNIQIHSPVQDASLHNAATNATPDHEGYSGRRWS